MKRFSPAFVGAIVLALFGIVGAVMALTETGPAPQGSSSASPAASDSSKTVVAGGGNVSNAVVVVNTKDQKEEAKAGLGSARVTGDTVANGNAAWAQASCTDCRTVAVAAQVVLAFNNPSTFTPTNLAVAFNEHCTRCTTMAFAYQYALTTDGVVYFSNAGEQTMASVRNRMSDVAHSTLPFDEMRARLDALAAELWRVVDGELKKAGVSGRGAPNAKADVDTADQSPSPSMSAPTDTTESPAPSPATTTPSPVESTPPEQSATPSPSPSDTQTP
jgi:putative peptide zinc metalloprotease protein